MWRRMCRTVRRWRKMERRKGRRRRRRRNHNIKQNVTTYK
jgi:hypothetical protein